MTRLNTQFSVKENKGIYNNNNLIKKYYNEIRNLLK